MVDKISLEQQDQYREQYYTLLRDRTATLMTEVQVLTSQLKEATLTVSILTSENAKLTSKLKLIDCALNSF